MKQFILQWPIGKYTVKVALILLNINSCNLLQLRNYPFLESNCWTHICTWLKVTIGPELADVIVVSWFARWGNCLNSENQDSSPLFSVDRWKSTYYGWYLVPVYGVVMLVATTPLFHAMGIWAVAMERAFGWNRTQLSLALSFSGLVILLCGRCRVVPLCLPAIILI